ncbi:MAG: hypothetical protein HEQ22_04340 [Sphingopyxis sp.]
MSSCSAHRIWAAANDVRQRYGDRAESLVERQIGWSRARAAQAEIDYWSAVNERLAQMRAPGPSAPGATSIAIPRP